MNKFIMYVAALMVPLFCSVKLQAQENSRQKENHNGAAIPRNIVKVEPLGFLSGVYPVLYERKLAKAFSVQIGAGITGHNKVREAFTTSGDDISVHYTYWPLNTSNYYNDYAAKPTSLKPRKALTGYLFTVQPRFYWKGQALKGLFISAAYDYYRYNFQIPAIDAAFQFTGPMQKEYEKVSDITLNMGYQLLFKKLSAEFSAGAGSRRVKGTKYVAYNQQDGIAKYDDNGVVLNIGFKLGYQL